MRTTLAYEDFEDSKKITTVYLEEVRNFLKKSLGASYVLPRDYQVYDGLTLVPGVHTTDSDC